MQRSAEFVVACSNAAELLELIEEAFDVVDLSGQVGFAQLDAYSSTEINNAPIKTEEIDRHRIQRRHHDEQRYTRS